MSGVRSRPLVAIGPASPQNSTSRRLLTVPAASTVIVRHILLTNSTATAYGAWSLTGGAPGRVFTLTGGTALAAQTVYERTSTYVVLGPGDILSLTISGASATATVPVSVFVWGSLLYGAPDSTPLV